MVQPGSETGKLQVFISYSRDDLTFADQLDEGLRACGFATMIDRHGISGGEDWKHRLGNLIRDADTIVFVLSSSSAKSEICAWEVSEAARLGKRIIPVVCQPLDGASAPPQLAELNYIFFCEEPKSPGSGWGSGLARLMTALNTDLDWLREHTRLLQRATEWDTGGRPENRLLSGADIAAAKNWNATRPKDAPLPTSLHLDFIKASEERETDRQSQERRRLEEREQLVTAAEEALKREQAAQSARKRGRVAVYMLLVGIIAGLVAFINQDFLREQYTWRVVMRPTVLTPEQEKEIAANPGPDTTFAECKNGCPTMVVIPAGSFMMGGAGGEKHHVSRLSPDPQHEVTIPRPFAVSQTEVTWAQWEMCVRFGRCNPLGPLSEGSDEGWGKLQRPVINVSWHDAQDYARWLSMLTGQHYRLLSEAEWEYAARARSTTKYSWGNNIGIGNANCNQCGDKRGNNEKTMPVRSFRPNRFGLYDMHGNVWEWVEDCGKESYHGKPDELKMTGAAWTTSKCVRKVLRGGGWNSLPITTRSVVRVSTVDKSRSNNVGIRLGRTLSQ